MQNWFLFFEKIGINVITIPNSLDDPIAYINNNDIKGIVLSGGNDISILLHASNPAPERDNTENLLLMHAQKEQLPVIGVCRGLQVINLFFKGEVMRSEGHAATSHEVYSIMDRSKFSDYKIVNSYHNYVIPKNKLGISLKPTLMSNDNYIEAFQHENLPWLGIMWHPEREHPFKVNDINLFKNHFSNK